MSSSLPRCFIYKGTINEKVSVKRECELHLSDSSRASFRTYHNREKNENQYKQFILDKTCSITPIVSSTKSIRKEGTWAITAAVSTGMETLDLSCFTISWPASWAPMGYSTFEFGFTTEDEANLWHSYISEAINSSTQGGDKPIHKISNAASLSTTSAHVKSSSAPPIDTDTKSVTPANTVTNDQAAVDEEFHDADEEESDDEDEAPADSTAVIWTPYRHISGVAVYRHLVRDEHGIICEEFMVSQPIRASPKRCLKFLIGRQWSSMEGEAKRKGESRSHSILGPASQVTPLSSSSLITHSDHVASNDSTSSADIISIILEAGGVAGAFCAPREAIVERVVKPDPKGSHLTILFSSLPTSKLDPNGQGELHAALQEAREAWAKKEEAEIEMHAIERPGLFRTPVPCQVQGSYTIAPMRNRTLENSEEALVTLVLRVDLGGSLGKGGGWRRQLFNPLLKTLSDAFLVRNDDTLALAL